MKDNQTKLDKLELEVMKELHNVAGWYRSSGTECARNHYDLYASIVIQESDYPDKDSLFSYWEGLKKHG